MRARAWRTGSPTAAGLRKHCLWTRCELYMTFTRTRRYCIFFPLSENVSLFLAEAGWPGLSMEALRACPLAAGRWGAAPVGGGLEMESRLGSVAELSWRVPLRHRVLFPAFPLFGFLAEIGGLSCMDGAAREGAGSTRPHMGPWWCPACSKSLR